MWRATCGGANCLRRGELAVVVSHPSAQNAEGVGERDLWPVETGRTEDCGFPGLKSETGGTQLFG